MEKLLKKKIGFYYQYLKLNKLKNMKLLKIGADFYIIIDNSNIEVGDFVFDGSSTPHIWTREDSEDCQYDSETPYRGCKKIIYSTSPLVGTNSVNLGVPVIEISEIENILNGSKNKKTYTEKEVFQLMCIAFEVGYNKYDMVDSGLEKKETDVEVNWIIKKYSKPKTGWDVKFVNGKLKLK